MSIEKIIKHGSKTKDSSVLEVGITPFAANEAERSSIDVGIDPKIASIFEELNNSNFIHLNSQEKSSILKRAHEAMLDHEEQLRLELEGLLKEIQGEKDISIHRTFGVFEGSLEPSYRIQITIPNSTTNGNKILSVFSEFATRHDQKEFHVSRVFDEMPTDVKIGEVDEEGISFVRNFEFELIESLQTPEVINNLTVIIQKFIAKNRDQEGGKSILGYTIQHPKGFTFYMVPSDSGITDEQVNQFRGTLIDLYGKIRLASTEMMDKGDKALDTEPINLYDNVRMLKVFRRKKEAVETVNI